MHSKLLRIGLLLTTLAHIAPASAEILTAECRCEEKRNGATVLNDEVISWEIDTEAETVNKHRAELLENLVAWIVPVTNSIPCAWERHYVLNRHPTGYVVTKACRRGDCHYDRLRNPETIPGAPASLAAFKCAYEDCSKHEFYGLTSLLVDTCGAADLATQQHCQCEMKLKD